MAAPLPPSLGSASLGPAIGNAQSAASAATSVLSSAIPSGADIGGFLKEQRQSAKLSLRRLAEEAGVSNPYLSQIERGLRRPSAEILQQLAKALRISAEQLYVQAGLLEDRGTSQAVEAALVSDVAITERQKRVLLDIYASFLVENEALAAAADLAGPDPVVGTPARKTTKQTTKRAAKKTTKRAAKKATKKATKKAAKTSGPTKATKTSAGTSAKRTTRKSPAKKTTRTAAPRSAS
jgi:transcriptional regulator with XRE-family HTH domain